MKRKSSRLLSFLLILVAGVASAQEWPSWRGPDQQGVSPETGLINDWSPDGENLIWHVPFIGRSTPVVFDGRACVIGRVGEGIDRQEVVSCYDAQDGKQLWEHRFNVYHTTVPFNRVGWASLVGDPETGNVYAHGVAGQLIAYDRSGKIVWEDFLNETLGHLSGYGGRTQTPLIDGDLLIMTFVTSGWGKNSAPRHRYHAWDKRTGELVWMSTPGGMPADMNTQSAPMVAEIGGQRLLIAGNADGWIYAVKVATGEKVWGFHLSKRGINSSVLVAGDRVFASHSEENLDDALMGRVVAIDGTGKGDVTATHELWRINEMSAGFPSPAYKDGTLYVVDNSANLHAIDAATGKVAWTESVGTVGKASPVIADGKIYVTETNGRVHILKPGREGAQVLSSREVELPEGRYAEIYGSPAIAYGRIYISTEGGLFCLGDKTKKVKVPAFRTAKAGKSKPRQASASPAWVQVVPADVLLEPGQSVKFEARGFDAKGEPIGLVDAEWKLAGVTGSIDGKGKFTADQAVRFAGGEITATVGQVSGASSVRVIGPLPWFEDFSSSEVDDVPVHWVGAKAKYAVREKDGEKALSKLYRPRGLLRTAMYMGPSTMSNYTMQADLMGGNLKRRKADIGLINSGYTLDLLGNLQRVQVRSWASEERMAKEVDFPWEMDVWYTTKMRVETGPDKATILGKVWKKGDPEPAEWTITVEDPHPIRSGSPGLIGYSPVDIYYDNIKVTVNE